MNLQLVPNTNLKVVDIKWFSGRDAVGIVLVEDMSLHYTKAYIGTGAGFDEGSDIEQIAQWGAKIPKEMAESLFGPLPDWKE